MTTSAVQIARARANGIKIPIRAYRAATAAGMPFWAMCAFLEQESGGGANVFGHDASIYKGAGTVTKAKYLAYKKERDRLTKRRMQGVGPLQLTWWEYQDQADALKGCWDIYSNLLVGAKVIMDHHQMGRLYRADGDYGYWRYAAYKFNGAQSYVDSIQPKFDKWKRILA